MRDSDVDPSCAVAHGEATPERDERMLVAVFASPVAEYVLRYGADLGYVTVLLEPDPERAVPVLRGKVVSAASAEIDGADVVVTDHHRPELGTVLKDLLGTRARWIGLMGNPRHPGPHVALLSELGVPAGEIARVRRPIGLNIGSRTPPEIAIATLAGLLADRNGRPGGFEF
jgi:xanthine/CO dehydrogenase XdhC/CoxF family maturation factor